MERKSDIVLMTLITIIFFLSTNSIAQNRDSIFYECYKSTDMDTWKQTMEQMKTELQPGNYQQLFDVTLAWYGYIGYCLGNDRKKEAEFYLNSGWQLLDKLLKIPEAGASAYAFKSAFYGFRIALAKYKVIIWGPKSVSALNKAASIDSTNVHYLVERGNQLYYVPSILGGDKEVALYHYKHAVDLIEAGKVYPQNHWFYLNTLVALAHTYEAAGQIDKARKTYLKIHHLAPDFKWLNEYIWPRFAKKYGE
jgi:tetratricopeptide (TPR) repeat protein